jgi:polar amino acid transport system substrate-binding protein
MNGDLPMTTIAADGTLSGMDGDLLVQFATNLGLTVIPQQMDWAAEIESTKTGRVDVMLGDMGWKPDRAEVMFLTDPYYYQPRFLTQSVDTNLSSISDLAGTTAGVVTGFGETGEILAMTFLAGVQQYDTTDQLLRDMVAGRIDWAILDPPLTEAALAAHPEWNLHDVPMTWTDADRVAWPAMATSYQTVLGVNINEPGLGEALNREIQKAWANCANVEALADWGIINRAFFQPAASDTIGRQGVDRPADWVAPTAD